MKTLIVGANGKVGTILSGKMWAAHDFSPVALIRDPVQQTKFTALGLPSAVGDLEAGMPIFCLVWMQWFLPPDPGDIPVRKKPLMSTRTGRFA